MRTPLLVLLPAALALVLTGCGGSSKASSPTTATTPGGSTVTTTHVAKQASNEPSESAKMICEDEAAADIYDQATGVKTIAPLKATWVDHVYSCDYVYPKGAVIKLAVKEVSDTAETTAYFDSLATKLHKTRTLTIGQGAFQVQDGSVVVRKDYKVLLVDITKLPANFGLPAAARGDVAINVAETIMSCWTGA